jgi:signal transduction histidine kinase
MSEDDSEWSVSVDRYPGPVCRYAVADGTPVVDAVDAQFERAFGPVAAGTALPEAFDAAGLVATDVADVTRAVSDADQFAVTAGTKRYLVQPVPPRDGDPGTLVFTEAPSRPLGVEDVASVVSHDLRNPLDVAKTRLRAGREFDEDEHFEHVERAHERMERIIEDVLTLARGEELVDPDEPVALAAVAETAWDSVDTGDATLTVAGPLPTATVDVDRVERLFENLFRNSVEHGSTGPGSQAQGDTVEHGSTSLDVTVGRLDCESTDGFYVADDGVGIPPAERDLVVQPGYTSDAHGTGLGLAIVDRIADRHGWSVSVTAAAGGGARVEIRGVEPA